MKRRKFASLRMHRDCVGFYSNRAEGKKSDVQSLLWCALCVAPDQRSAHLRNASKMMWQVRPERPEDANAIEALVIATFGAGRFAKTAYRLREGVAPVKELSFVATAQADGNLLGSIRFWPVTIGGQPALLVGPLAVRPDLRGKGIGTVLLLRTLEDMAAQAYKWAIIGEVEPVAFYKKVCGAVVIPGS